MAYTTEDKTEELVNSLEAQCINNYQNKDLNHIEPVHDYVNNELENPDDQEIVFMSK